MIDHHIPNEQRWAIEEYCASAGLGDRACTFLMEHVPKMMDLSSLQTTLDESMRERLAKLEEVAKDFGITVD